MSGKDEKLFAAVARNNYPRAKKLLKKGADVNARDTDSLTMLHRAALTVYTKWVALLLDRGADVNARMWNGATPLYVAAHKGHTETAALLRKHASF